ncbi:MAG TPA: BTAD domain-containing putative transcriptional regulator, partial [Candidatus Baltobacteraceae bacterium]
MAVSPSPTLAVRLFGQRQLTFGEEPLRFGAPVRALSLLAYLLLNRDRVIARDSLAYTLWPDEPEADARAKLRRHLYLLHNDVLPPYDGKQWILTDARTVRWNPAAPLWLDVAEFDRLACDPQTASAAAELYNGDLLADIDDEWLAQRRAQYRERFFELLMRLATVRRTRGDFSAALGYVKILLQHDPWREDGVRLFMELRHQLGDRASAMREYRDFARRLKDEVGVEPMPETVRLFETMSAIVEAQSATFTEASIPRNDNLPVQLTSLHGRESDLSEVRGLIEQSRLVMLAGAAGVGKSRLAIEVATRSKDRFADGVWLVEFAAISEGALVVPSLAAALNVREHEGRSLVDSIIESLKAKDTLIILDNCEHLIDAIAELVGRLVRASARVRILGTSREPLRVAGERIFRVAPLSLPATSADELPSLAALKESPAVRLFFDRALAVMPEFEATNADCDALLMICRRLDGIPFAIELAAARVRLMSLQTLAKRLGDRFRILTGGDRTALPRQQTLRALLDWSYNLLTL